MRRCNDHPDASFNRTGGQPWVCSVCGKEVDIRTCLLCGQESECVVNIALKAVPLCDSCCLAITKQTVAAL